MKKENLKIGYINQVEGSRINIAVNKEEAPKEIYPINEPSPLYVKDSYDNLILIYQQIQSAPTSELPSLNFVKDDKVITIDPAKDFILQSPLAMFQCLAVLVKENAIVRLLDDVEIVSKGNLIDYWKKYGFNNLKLIAENLAKEEFKIFMRNFSLLLSEVLIKEDSIRKSFLKVLVEIGSNTSLNAEPDYLSYLETFMESSSIALILDNQKSEMDALVRLDKVKYGDLIYFENNGDKKLAAVKEIHRTAKLFLLYAIENKKPTSSVSPLDIGIEGYFEGVEDILKVLTTSYGESYAKIPIGKIPSIDQEYKILFKGNELIHFAIIAISGAGKGNALKVLIFEKLKSDLDYFKDKSMQNPSSPGIIIFDDVGEYIRALKPMDWGLDIGAFVLKLVIDNEGKKVKIPIHFIEIYSEIDKSNRDESSDFEFIRTAQSKIPIEYVPVQEVIRSLENLAGYNVIPTYLRDFYRKHKKLRPANFLENRLTIPFINEFLGFNTEDGHWTQGSKKNRDQFGYKKESYDVALRALKEYLFNNRRFIGIDYDWNNEEFHYNENIRTKTEVEKQESLADEYNLLKVAENCASKGEVLIIDESSLNPSTKLMVQRIVLNHIVDSRESSKMVVNPRPCLIIIEEATALMRGQPSSQLQLFSTISVRARKFGVGLGLVLQDISNFEPSLLTQLGWMIAMGLPVDSMRSTLFRNVPSDLGPFDDYIKYADVGLGVGFQKLIGKYLPLPVKIYHYEGKVRDELKNISGGLDETMKNYIRAQLNLLNVSEEVVNSLLNEVQG